MRAKPSPPAGPVSEFPVVGDAPTGNLLPGLAELLLTLAEAEDRGRDEDGPHQEGGGRASSEQRPPARKDAAR
jgi:hypothetical protein